MSGPAYVSATEKNLPHPLELPHAALATRPWMARRRREVSKISSAVLCHTNGLGSSVQSSVQWLMESFSSVTERRVPRRAAGFGLGPAHSASLGIRPTALSTASGICPVADSRTARSWPTELPSGGRVFCPLG